MTPDNGTVAPHRPTLGERLDLQGRHLRTRLLMPLPWAGPLHALLDRAAGMGRYGDRFDRIEATPEHPPPVPANDWAALPVPCPQLPSGLRGPVSEGPASPSSTSESGVDRRPIPPDGTDGAGAPVDSPSAPLPATVRSRLREVAGQGADAMRVHDDGLADAFARAHRADAVTVGRDVYFRRGRLRPVEESGFGLLAHEAVHVLALLRPGAAWHRATGAGVSDEEATARALERSVVSGEFLPTAADRWGREPSAGPVSAETAGRPAAAVPAAGTVAQPPGSAQPPPDAAVARPLPAPADRGTATEPGAAPAALDVRALRRDLVSDVMRQLRSEFERGG